MKKVLAASALGVMLSAAMAVPAMAKTQAVTQPTLSNNITTNDDDGTYKAVFAKGSGTGTFATMFDFTLSSESSVLASVTNSFTKYLSLTAFSIENLATHVFYNGSFTTTNGSQQGTIPSFVGLAGNYQLTVDGSVIKAIPNNLSQKASFNGNVSINPVPLPTSVALFGVGLAGLGIAGAVRRKATAKANA